MAVVPLALSVHNFISSVGADAGFASVIGLAILALLYFAHARETASLREEAAGLAQRLQEAEARLAEARRVQAVASRPAASANAAPQAAQGNVAGATLAPAAPAGVAAPALAAATRFIPIPAAAPAPAAAALAAPATAPAEAEPVAEPAQAPVRVTPPAPSPAGGPLAIPAGASNPAPAPAGRAASVGAATISRPATVAGAANGIPPAPRPAAADRYEEPLAPPAFRRPAPSAPNTLLAPAVERRGSAGRRFAALVGILVLIGAAAAAVIVTSSTSSPSVASPSHGGNSLGATAGFDPAHVTVAVLNGTAINQLAHHVAARLTARGYKEGVVATASNQTMTSTVVAYLPGPDNRLDALHVARTLHLGAGSVVPVDQAARAVACPPPAACPANVVVTVGQDLAGT